MIRVHIDARAGERVALSVRVLRAPAARAQVAELLAYGSRPAYLHPMAEWVDERDVPAPYAAEAMLVLDGPRGTAYAGAAFRLHLLFPAAYPGAPPFLRFGCQLHHEQVGEGGLLEPHFYAQLGWERKPGRHVRAVLAAVHELLLAPLPAGTRLGRPARLRLLQLQRLRTHGIASYTPFRRHAALFAQPPVLQPGWIEPALLAACDARDGPAIRGCCEELCLHVYALPLFSRQLCGLLLDEIGAFEASGLPAARPNSMNRYGVLLDEIGLERLMDALRTRVLAPLAQALYGVALPAALLALDHHHAFTVAYAPGGDRSLDMHHDDSEVTLNACLGTEFEGAGLTFCGRFGEAAYRTHAATYAHRPGHAVLHLGSQRHGADAITAGQRTSLILWARSSAHRALPNREAPAHLRAVPDMACLSHTHDLDYEDWRPLPEGVVGKRERLRRLRTMGGG